MKRDSRLTSECVLFFRQRRSIIVACVFVAIIAASALTLRHYLSMEKERIAESLPAGVPLRDVIERIGEPSSIDEVLSEIRLLRLGRIAHGIVSTEVKDGTIKGWIFPQKIVLVRFRHGQTTATITEERRKYSFFTQLRNAFGFGQTDDQMEIDAALEFLPD